MRTIVLINKINFPQIASNNNGNNKIFAVQNQPALKQLECDTFVKFTGRRETTVAENIDRIRDTLEYLRFEPKHAEKRRRQLEVELLYDIAMIDVLTGLRNKRAFFEDLGKDIKTAKEKGEPVSVAMFDMDNFKSVNEILDHHIGDKFLKVIGNEVNQVAEQHGYWAYRFGGEEFIITMPGYNIDAAASMAEEIRKNIAKNPKLQDYYGEFVEKGQEKIAELQKTQKALVEFKDQLNEYEAREKSYQEALNNNEDTLITSYLGRGLAESRKILGASFQKTLEYALIHADSNSKKRYLSGKIKSFQKSSDARVEYDEKLKNYLNTNFNKEFEIAQIGTWLSHAQTLVNGKPQGFTITAGVKEFKDLDIPIEDFVKKTDAVLKGGKVEHRGKVYAA